MIQDVGNIELCELLETEPKTQSKVCLSYWDIGIVCCTCGHFLQKETEVNRKIVKYTMDLLSLSNQLKKNAKSKEFQGTHDRFLRDHEFRVRMIEHNRDEEVCRRWDALADGDHIYHLSEQEYFYYKNGGSIPISRAMTPNH